MAGIPQDGNVLAGTHVQSWNPDRLASGIYFVVMKNRLKNYQKRLFILNRNDEIGSGIVWPGALASGVVSF